MLDDELQILHVFFGQRSQVQIGIGKVDPLVGSEFSAATAGGHDFYQRLPRMGFHDSPGDLAVVKQDALSLLQVGEDFG